MRALYYQPAAGIAGDMHLGALIDLGVPEDYVRSELARLSLPGEYTLEVERAQKMGISGTRVNVTTAEQTDHRHYSAIVRLLADAALKPEVTALAGSMFKRIAEAEAKIHGISVEEVHFHEVGAIDAIVDLVGAAIAVDYLAPEVVLCNPIEVGSGYVNCAHGRFPVPAPATQEILANAPCLYGGVDGESTTPSGAAILAATVTEYAPTGAFTPQQYGYGIGHKDFTVPNVLRVVLGEYAQASQSERHFKIEANVDDMPAEAFEPLLAELFAAGASDVYFTPIVMKKSRPATCINVLSDTAHVQSLTDLLLNSTTTIGLRVLPFEKRMLERETQVVETTFGAVHVKVVRQPDGRRRFKIEHDDVQQLAKAAGRDYQSTRRSIDLEVSRALDL